MERAIKELRYLREVEINKKPALYSLIKKQTGYTDKELNDYLEEIDEEKIDIDELIEQSPIKLKAIDKIGEITKSIQEIKRQIKNLYG